jgi:hypothetical protein
MRLAGRDAVTARVKPEATGEEGAPALLVNKLDRGRAVYLNGFLGYNLQSRQWMRNLLGLAGVSSPARITSGGQEHMGYECAAFSRGGIRVLGVLRLRDEAHPTQVQLDQPGHLYDVRSKKYFGLTDTAQFDLTEKAAAVLAVMPYEVRGVEMGIAPEHVKPAGEVTMRASVAVAEGVPGDHVLHVEVYDPAGRLSRAYTDNVLAAGGRWQGSIPTAMNDQPGAWRVVVDDVISGKRGEASFVIGESE